MEVMTCEASRATEERVALGNAEVGLAREAAEARAHNLSAAMGGQERLREGGGEDGPAVCIGSHSRQYVPWAQQLARTE